MSILLNLYFSYGGKKQNIILARQQVSLLFKFTNINIILFYFYSKTRNLFLVSAQRCLYANLFKVAMTHIFCLFFYWFCLMLDICCCVSPCFYRANYTYDI